MLWAALALAATLGVLLGPALVGAYSLTGVDVLQYLAPWSATAPPGIPDRFEVVGDTVNAILPIRQVAGHMLAAGDLPLWTSLPAGGAYVGVTPDYALLSPPQLPYLVLPLWYAPAVVKLVEMLVAAGFTALFLRRLGASWCAGAVGGAVYMSSGFQLAWTGWPQATTGALIPALFWAVERSLQLRTAPSLVPVALATASLVASGFPAVTGWALLACGGYAVARTWRSPGAAARRLSLLVGLAVAVVLGVLLVSVQLFPFAVGMQERGGLGYRAQDPSSHLPWAALATAVVPRALGLGTDGSWFGPRNAVELLGFVGVTAVALVTAAFVLRRRMTPAPPPGAVGSLWVVLGLCIVLAYAGGPLLALAQQALPPLFGGNFIGRLRSLVGFSAAVLAGLGLHALLVAAPLRLGRADAWRLGVVAAVLAGLALAVVPDLLRWDDTPGERDYLRGATVLPLAVTAVLLVLAVVLVLSRRGPPVLRLAIPALVAVEALAVGVPYLPRTDRALFYPSTTAHEYVRRTIGADRLLAADRAFFPGSTTYYGIRTTAAHSFLEPRWRDLLTAVQPDAFSSYTYPRFGMSRENLGAVATSPILDRLSTRYWAASPREPIIGQLSPVQRARSRILLAQESRVDMPMPAGPLRGVVLRVAERWTIGAPVRADLVATVRGPDGRVLGIGSRRLDQAGGVGQLPVPIVEADIPAGSTLRLELRAPAGRVVLSGDAGGLPLVSVVRPGADGLRLVFTKGVSLYRRLDALPRIRWADRRIVQPDPVQRVRLLASGRLPDDMVLLDSPVPQGSGAPARLTVVQDESQHVVVDVDARGAGWVVVADADQHGFQATVDGAPAALLPADHALVAIRVPAGRSRVELAYRPPELRTGAAVSAAAALGIAGLVFVPAALHVLRRRRRRRSGVEGTPSAGPPSARSVGHGG